MKDKKCTANRRSFDINDETGTPAEFSLLHIFQFAKENIVED